MILEHVTLNGPVLRRSDFAKDCQYRPASPLARVCKEFENRLPRAYAKLNPEFDSFAGEYVFDVLDMDFEPLLEFLESRKPKDIETLVEAGSKVVIRLCFSRGKRPGDDLESLREWLDMLLSLIHI